MKKVVCIVIFAALVITLLSGFCATQNMNTTENIAEQKTNVSTQNITESETITRPANVTQGYTPEIDLHKLNVELVKEERVFVEEQEFPWGMVSLNTRKSIHKPGETAEFIIVALDKDGRPVCNADISLTVSNPDNEKTTYSTSDGTITARNECGIYDANYSTVVEGNHTIDITALIDDLEVYFTCHFLVQQDYEFDIIRTALSKIDPTRQDRFDVTIDIESFTDADSVTIKEFVPAGFDVSPVDAATVLLEDDMKTIIWNKDLIGNKTSVSYSYSVPHIWPYLYALGPTEIDYFDKTCSKSFTFEEARPWYVAVDPSSSTKGMIAYGEGTVTTPRYRIWDGTDWESEQSANDVGGVTNMVVLRSAKTRNEKILGVLDTSGHINVQVWDGSAWGTVLEVTTAIGANCDYRGFDIAYEGSSDDAIIVYQNNVADPLYRVWNGTGWSDAATLDLPTAGIPVWVRMASKPGSDEIIVATLDKGSNVTAAVWDGSAWGNNISLEGAAESYKYSGIAVAYEFISGDAMVAWSDGGEAKGGPQYNFWNGTAWGSEATAPETGDESRYIELSSDPLGDTIVMGAVNAKNTPYVDANIWNGTAWGDNARATTSAVKSSLIPADIGFESTNGEAIIVYAENNDNTLHYKNWSAGSGWSTQKNIHLLSNQPDTVVMRPNPNSDNMMIVIIDDVSDLQTVEWNGSAWGTVDILETGVSSTFASFMFNYDIHFLAPVVQTPHTYDNITMAAKTTFHINEGMTVRVNVTDESGRGDISKVLIKILNTTNAVKVDNATMTNITEITNGYTYEYNYTIPSDADLGTWNIYVYANDTDNAWDSNTTTFGVYKWSNVTWVSPPDESSYEVGGTITLTCLVRDANTSSGIENYPVRFYNKTDFTVTYLGLNYTNSSGYAVMDWDTTGVAVGWYYPKCNISDNSTLFYTVTADNKANTSVELSYVTTLEIKNQINVTAIGSINFSGVSGATVSNPHNNVDGSGSPQDITSKTPVVTIYNPSSSTNYKIWLKVTDGTGWDNIISDEKFNVTADGVSPGGVSSWATLTSWGSYKNSGVTISAGTHKDLYLAFSLKGSGTGSSTLSVLGEAV